MLYIYILLGICGGSMILAAIVAIIFKIKRILQSKEIFTKDKIQEYEQDLKKYLEEYDVADFENLEQLCELREIDIINEPQTSKLLKGREAVVYEENGHYKVYVDDCLNESHKRFAIAHEVAHVVKGDAPLPAWRDEHKFLMRSAKEQIRDYIAAAILLPMDEFGRILQASNYSQKSKKEKMIFIETISKTKKVEMDVVIRRIKEYNILNA